MAPFGPSGDTIIDVLERRAARTPEHVAYRFLEDGTASRSISCTYRELWVRVGAVSVRLRELGLSGRRVVLALPPGVDHVAAFFGVLQAGATVVPAAPATGRRAILRLAAVVLDCEAAAVVSESGHRERFRQLAGEIAHPVQ
jgi:acyl-CoA synthetase (AMP-forming)/AMP-acid ligase II